MTCVRDYPKSVFAWLAILALLFVAMWPGLKGGFFFDDVSNIVKNDAIHITALSIDSLRSSVDGPAAGPLGRPVSVISFALTHYFFGLDASAFKTINLFIHACNGFLVAWLLSLLLPMLTGLKLSEATAKWLPRWVAAAWLLHPINILPVMLAVQRMTLLAALFLLLALICHVKALSFHKGTRRWSWLAAAWLLFWPLSVLSKETGLLFPLYILLITLFLPPATGAAPPKKSLALSLLIFALAGSVAAMFFYLGPKWLEGAYAMRSFSLSERLLTEARVLWFYLAQIIAPRHSSFGLYLDDIPLSTGWLSPPQTLLALIGWLAACLAIASSWRRLPVFSFALLWFLCGHSLESTILPLEIAHEYRNYLPSFGVIVGVGYFGAQALQKLKSEHRAVMVTLAALLPLIILALFTWLRAQQLGDPIEGSQIEAAHHPLSARANYEAGITLIKTGHGDAGDSLGAHHIRHYLLQSMTVDPSFKFGHLGLIAWSCASERPIEQHWIDTFAHRLQHTAFAPGDLKLPDNLLKPLLSMPTCLNRKDALGLFAAGANNPRIPGTLRARFLESAADYELLVSLDPYSAKSYMAQALLFAPHNPALQQKAQSFDGLKTGGAKQELAKSPQ